MKRTKMKRTLAAAAALLMLAASPSSAQGPRGSSEWVMPSAGPASADGVAATADGGVVVAGRAGGHPQVVRLDASGKLAESWSIPGSDAWPRAVAALPGAVAVVAGPADPPGSERGISIWRILVGEDGRMTQDWHRRFRRTAVDGGTGAVPTEDGGLVVVGWTGGGMEGAPGGAWILRLDSEGDSAWRRIAFPFAPTGVFEARAAAKGENGQVLVAAYGAAAPDMPGGVWMLKFDRYGHDYAQKVIDELADERPEAMAAMADGGWAVAGRVSPPGEPGRSEAWVARADLQGNLLWDRKWGPAEGRSVAAGLAALPDGGLLAVGWLARPDGGSDAWAARLGPGGETLWESRPGPGRLNALTLLPDGSAMAVGAKMVKGREQMWAVKLGL